MKGPIVLLTTSMARGGAETQVALLAVELSRRGWPVHVVSMIEPSAFQAELSDGGVALHSLGMQPGRADLMGAARLGSILRKVRPLALHSHLFHANLMGRLARLAFPLPRVISTIHSLAESSRETSDTLWRDRLYRMTDPLADCTVAVCQAAADRHAKARAVSPKKLRVIPNGVDTNKFRPDESQRAVKRVEMGVTEEFVWLAAGRLMWKKDYPTLLRAAARQPGCQLWIAGSGPLEAELRRMADVLGVYARFLGEREDLPDLMRAADGYVLSSVVEGLPMVLLEAASSGVPLASTDVGGACEVVRESETGFLAPCGDDEALARAMAKVSGMAPEARRRMGMAARALAVERFGMEAVTTKWEALYGEW